MNSLTHRGYVLNITYNSISGLYEGLCSVLGIVIYDVSPEYMESDFQRRVDEQLGEE